MNYAFAVALDRPAADRSMQAHLGDAFTVAVTFYDEDGDTAAATLAGATASLEVVASRGCDPEFTIAGTIASGVATFDFAGTDLSGVVGRSAWRVKLVRAGAPITALYGAFTVVR